MRDKIRIKRKIDTSKVYRKRPVRFLKPATRGWWKEEKIELPCNFNLI